MGSYLWLEEFFGLTIYNWEGGKAKPRQEKVASLAAMRGVGKREALKRLEMMAG